MDEKEPEKLGQSVEKSSRGKKRMGGAAN